MSETQTKKSMEPRRYLPDRLWERWQAGESALAQEHLRDVLRAVLTYLPRRVAQARLAEPDLPAVEGSFSQATLMFADISGFTAMSERLTQQGREGAEVITGIVNDYFETMLATIARHGGDLFKFGGDALLVYFGGEAAAARGCRAAWEMQQAMARFAVIPTKQGTFNLRMKVGLGTGTLFLASLGTPERLEFAVMGPALGRMARAESLAEAGQVLIDKVTRKAAGAEIEAAGHSEGFYRLTQAREAPFLQETERPVDSADLPWLVERLDALTLYLPPRLLERIVAFPGQIMIEGEHRPVTVLFANFYGIDEIIAGLGADRADELTAILNRHFTAMQDVIHKYGGVVNKVDTYAVGYRIMALFGAPVAHEDDPVRAVRAALEMQEAMAAFTDLSTSAGRFALKQRIGVNTGYVFAGNLGSTLRQEYSVMGDEVNLAARLMGAAAEGEVLISQSTARHVEGLFEWQEREPVEVKGKRQPVRNYRVSRSVAGQTVARGIFFGRQEELAMAQSLVDRALGGRGGVLDVTGDRGIGKSRLVQELCAYAGERGMTTLRGEALSYGRNIPYLPWLEVAHALLGWQEGKGQADRREKLLEVLDRAGLLQWAPIVGGVLGVEIAETPLTASLDAQMRQQRFFDVLLQLIQDRARDAPLLLVLDDVQWADAVSLDLVAYVARNLSDAPLLFVLVHWMDMEATPWIDQEGAGTFLLSLAEMDVEASLALARSILGQGELGETLRHLILDRAQGNPLFVEEVTRTLRESGAIRLDPEMGLWVLAETAANTEVPTTLAGLIMSRIDRLETINRRLLQVASVVGVAFRAPVLARVYPYTDLDGTLPRRLEELIQIDLMTFAFPDRYTFKQALTQEVAYGSLPFARRRELHARVGAEIEARHAGELAEYYGLLARHFDEGQVFDKAFVFKVKAGDKARADYANEDALELYRRALELATEIENEIGPGTVDEGQVLDLLEEMGDVCLDLSRYDEAVQQFRAAIAHPQCTTRRWGDLLRKIAKTYEQQGQYDEALAHLAQGRQVLAGEAHTRESAEMARIHNLSGWVHTRRGEMEQAIQDCERGLDILAQLTHDQVILREEADLYNTLGTVYAQQGNYSRAAEAYQHSTDLRQQAGDLPGLARSYNNLALVAWSQGYLAAASDYLRRMLEISQQIGNNYFLAFGYNNLGAIAFKTGDVAQALEHYHAALTLQKRIGGDVGMAQSYSNIGEAHLSLGQHDKARHYLEQAANVCKAIHSEFELLEVYRLLAEVELAQGKIEPAIAYAEQARRTAGSIGSPELQGIAERTLAQARAEVGDERRAGQAFTASIASLRESENQLELAHSHYRFGLFLAEQEGRAGQAREHLAQAVTLYTAAGADDEADEARAALARSSA